MSFAETGIYSQVEFLARQTAGEFAPERTYAAYLQWRRRIEQRVEGDNREWLADVPNPEFGGGDEGEKLTAEDEMILDRAWAAIAAQRTAHDPQTYQPTSAAAA